MFPCTFKRQVSFLFVTLLLSLLLPYSITASSPFRYRQTPTPVPTPSNSHATAKAIGSIKTAANLRMGPGTDFVVAGNLKAGDVVAIVGINPSHTWYFLDSETWIASFLVNVSTEYQAQLPIASTIVTGSIAQNVSLRAGPGADFAVVGNLKAGIPVTMVGASTNRAWYLLESRQWIAAALVNITAGQQANLPIASIPEQAQFVKEALSTITDTLRDVENALTLEQAPKEADELAKQQNLNQLTTQIEQAQQRMGQLQQLVAQLQSSANKLAEDIANKEAGVVAASAADRSRLQRELNEAKQKLTKLNRDLTQANRDLSATKINLNRLMRQQATAQDELTSAHQASIKGEQERNRVITQNLALQARVKAPIDKWQASQTSENFKAASASLKDAAKSLGIEGKISALETPALASFTSAPEFTPVRVFYVTDRNEDTKAKQPGARYGTQHGALSFGTCIVTIPDKHKMGELEAPSIWTFDFKEDPAKHVILTAVNPVGKDQFYNDLNASMTTTHEAFVFIHGYNTTFEDAARRTAQIAYDLKFQGAPIFYSWPSRGTLQGYAADEESIQWSTEHIKNFIKEVAALTNAQTIHLIAHSMGNRGLTEALIELSGELQTAQRQKINQIVLAAPDINATIFKEQIAPRIVPLGQQITLYASSRDVALFISKLFHDFPRAGEAGSNIVLVDGIQTIDASSVNSVNSDLFNHGYPFALTVLADIYELFHDHSFPKDRFDLEPIDAATGHYWRFRHN